MPDKPRRHVHASGWSKQDRRSSSVYMPGPTGGLHVARKAVVAAVWCRADESGGERERVGDSSWKGGLFVCSRKLFDPVQPGQCSTACSPASASC